MCHELNLDGLQAAVAEAASAGECRYAGKAKWIVHGIGSHHNVGASRQAEGNSQQHKDTKVTFSAAAL